MWTPTTFKSLFLAAILMILWLKCIALNNNRSNYNAVGNTFPSEKII